MEGEEEVTGVKMLDFEMSNKYLWVSTEGWVEASMDPDIGSVGIC